MTRIPPLRITTLLPWVLAFSACGPGPGGGHDGGDGDGGGPVLRIEIAPPDAVITVANGAPGAQAYTATAFLRDGTSQDVSATAIWTIDEIRLGSFTGATFAANGLMGGISNVRASWMGTQGSTPVTVKVTTVRVVPPAPEGAPGLFGAATEDAGRAPAIVYPADQTMVPPNLGDFEVHWSGGAGNDLFEVSLTSAVLDLRAYMTTTVPGDMWTAFTPAEWAIAGASTRAGALKVTVRGMAAAAPATAGTSPPIAARVAVDDLEGGIYYWAASAAGVFRHDFGRPADPVESFYGTAETGRCVACHALSLDGTRMAVTFDGGDGAATVIDVATRTALFPTTGTFSNFTVFSPDASRMIMTSFGVFTLRDPTTAAILQTVPTASGYATHPDFSPLGDQIVYVNKPAAGSDWGFTGGHIVTQPFEETTDTFGAPADLVPAGGENAYYPSFSPDALWVLFNRSVEDAYDDASAQLWVVPSDGSQAPILLSSPNVGGGLTNSWARWAPFVQAAGGPEGGSMFWFTFSSKRAFGVRLPGGGRPQIWMAPFFPDRARAGEGPSLPAFRLPFQDLATSNHIAQWTTQVVPIE